jgi:hypothetical protein
MSFSAETLSTICAMEIPKNHIAIKVKTIGVSILILIILFIFFSFIMLDANNIKISSSND